MNIKQNHKKIIGISLIINIIAMSLIAVLVLSPAINTFTISSGIYPSAPTFTIWREDSTYYAKNAYGAIDYFNSNFTSVWEYARDSTPLIGGRIFLKAGIYVIPKVLVWQRSNLWLDGEKGAKMIPSATFFDDHKSNNNSNVMIFMSGWFNGDDDNYKNPSNVHNNTISNIEFDGQYNAFDNIRIGGNVTNTEIYGIKSYGSPNRALLAVWAWGLQIHNNWFGWSRILNQINLCEDVYINDNYYEGSWYSDGSKSIGYVGTGNAIYCAGACNYTISGNVIDGNPIAPEIVVGNRSIRRENYSNPTSNILHKGITGWSGGNVIISDNIIRNVLSVGIFFYRSDPIDLFPSEGEAQPAYHNFVIDGNMISSFGHLDGNGGIWVGAHNIPADDWGLQHTVVSNNVVYGGNTGEYNSGIILQNSSYTTVIGNQIVNCTMNGIQVTWGSDYSIISNNIIVNTDYDDTSSSSTGGIWVHESDYLIIANNICTDSQDTPTSDYQIYIYTACDYIILDGNIANPYETAGIMVNASATNIKYVGNWNGTIWLSGD